MKHLFDVVNINCGGCAEAVEAARATLLRLGYPEAGSAAGMEALKAKAKSFVSCAVGRLASE